MQAVQISDTGCVFCLPWIVEHFVRNPAGHGVGCTNLLVVPICKWIRRPLRKISGRGLGLVARARGSTSSRSKLWIKLLKLKLAFAGVKLSDFTFARKKSEQLLLMAQGGALYVTMQGAQCSLSIPSPRRPFSWISLGFHQKLRLSELLNRQRSSQMSLLQ